MSKDRARPFSRKHRRYWIPVLGGMILIGFVNLIIGFASYDPPNDKREKMELQLPKVYRDAAAVDAAVDAPAPDAAIVTPSN